MIVVVALALLVGGCSRQSDAEPSPAASEELRVERGPFDQRLLLTGKLVAETAVELATPNANIWPVPVRWLAEDGTEVRTGDTVIEFDNSQISSNLENHESQAVEAQNQLQSLYSELSNDIGQAGFNVEQKKADFEKAEIAAAIPPEVSSKQEVERRRLELERARLELQAAEDQLASKKEAARTKLEVQDLAVQKALEDVRRTREGIELLTMIAPRDGIVLINNNSQEGRPFQTGDQVFPGEVIASLPDLSTMIVEADLFDVDDGKIQPGANVVATLDSFPSWPIRGTIREVESIADQTGPRSTRRTFTARVGLETIDPERMRPGMSVKLEVVADPEAAEAQPLLVPRVALRLSDREVLARLADGSEATVEIGPCNPEVCVLLEGLEEGAELAASTELSKARGGSRK